MLNTAIKLAIEKGGYDPLHYPAQVKKLEPDSVLPRTNITFKDGHWDFFYINDMLVSPEFWQSLGKALKWEGYQCQNCRHKHFGNSGFSECCPLWVSAATRPQWLYHALEFHETLLTGGDTEKFWKDLLK